jgi:hypothetical protein
MFFCNLLGTAVHIERTVIYGVSMACAYLLVQVWLIVFVSKPYFVISLCEPTNFMKRGLEIHDVWDYVNNLA